MKKTPAIKIARAYDLPQDAAGYRVLIDRLWPRGIKKTKLKLDAWLKEVAPSTELRKWFHADPENRFSEFVTRYRAELRRQDPAILKSLLDVAQVKTLWLIYSARDEQHNHAILLRDYLLKNVATKKRTAKKKTKKKTARP